MPAVLVTGAGRGIGLATAKAFLREGWKVTPEEVARVILWLGTSSPQYMSGATVDVNSGSYPR